MMFKTTSSLIMKTCRQQKFTFLFTSCLLFSFLICGGDRRGGVACHQHHPKHNIQKRWVDVDDENQQTKNIIRQQTPNLEGVNTQSAPTQNGDMNGLTNFVKDFDQGIGQRFESINDITNLRSLETNEQPLEPSTPIEALHNKHERTLNNVAGPVAALPLHASPQQEQFVNGFRGDDENRELAPPPSSLVMNNCADDSGAILSEGCGPPRLPVETPIADLTSVNSPDHAFHTADHNEIMVPQGNIFQSGSPDERVEPEIHQQSGEPAEHRLVPGRTVYLRPMHVVQRPRHVFRHIHHRPRFFLIHRTRQRRRRPRLSELYFST